MLGNEDSVLACLGTVVTAASSVFWWCAACVETLLAVFDLVWRVAAAAVTLACIIWGYLLAIGLVVKEFVCDVGLLLGGLVELTAFLLVAAFRCVQAVAFAVEQAVWALHRVLSATFDFVLRAIDTPRVMLNEAALSASTVDVRAFESTFWFVEKLGETLLASASWLVRSTIGVLWTMLTLPRDTLVGIESCIELVFASSLGALYGMCRAVATHVSKAFYKSASVIDGLREAVSLWSSADDQLSRLVACAAVVLLVVMVAADRLRAAWHEVPGSRVTSEGGREDSRNGSNQTTTSSSSGSGSAASSPRPSGVGETAGTARQHLPSDDDDDEGRRPWRASHRHDWSCQRSAAAEEETSAEPAGRCSTSAGGGGGGGGGGGSSHCSGDGRGANHDDAGGGLEVFIRQLQEQLEAEKERQLCVVCQYTPKTVLLLPCRHLCVCPECARSLAVRRSALERVCPLCRGAIVSAVPVYT